MAITLIALCLAIMTISILGGLLPLATVFNHTRLQVYLSFSAGTMLGAAFFHMLPEAVRVGSATTIHWAAVGLLSLFFLERFFSFHHHEPHTPTTVTDPHAGCAEHSEHPTNRDHAATHATESPGSIDSPSSGRCLGDRQPSALLFIHSSVGLRLPVQSPPITRFEPAWERRAWGCLSRRWSTNRPMR